MRGSTLAAATSVLGMLLPCCAFARDGGTDSSHNFNLYSIEREIALGKQLAAELERQIKLADDPILSEYVNRIAQNLARNSEAPLPIAVRIIESGDPNAFTLPGGHIYVTSAMVRLTESEAELAFVLAHEIGHASARHATRSASRDELAHLTSLPLSVWGGWTGLGVRQLAATGTHLGLLKGAREFETQADRLGVDYMERAGYDPEAAIDVFERIEGTERKTPGKLARLSGDHPITASRIADTQKYLNANTGKRPEYVITTSEYEQMRVRAVTLETKRAAEEGRTGPVLAR